MAFSRVAALRSSCFRGAVRSTSARVAPRPQVFRQIARRGYASGGHGETKAGGDAVWYVHLNGIRMLCNCLLTYVTRAAGAVAVTVPTCWYLLSNAEDSSHGHDEHSDSHASHKKDDHKEESDDESKDEPESKDEEEDKAEAKEDGDSQKSDDSDSDDDAKDVRILLTTNCSSL